MIKTTTFTLLFMICLTASSQNVKLKKVKDEYSNGQLKAKGKATPSDFGFGNKKYGEWEFYYENGNLKELSNWEDNSRVGSFISYFENGKVEAKGNYNNGTRNGHWEFFYNNGQPRLKCSFTNGEESGNWLEFFDNGNEKLRVILQSTQTPPVMEK